MDGWMDGWMCGWVGGWVDGWMGGDVFWMLGIFVSEIPGIREIGLR